MSTSQPPVTYRLMHLSRQVLLLLWALSPLQVLAQESELPPPPLTPAPAAPAPSTPPPSTPQGEIIPREWPAEEEPEYGAIPRIAFELLLGTLGGAAALTPEVLLLASLDSSLESIVVAFVTLVLVTPLTAIAVVVGTAGGIALAGKVLDGRGSLGAAAVGVAIGGSVGVLIAISGELGKANLTWVIPILAGSVVGGLIGYEFSHARAPRPRPSRVSSGGWVVPVVGATPRGGITAGLVGAF